MKAEGFGNSKILKIRNDHVIIPRNVKNGHFSKKKKKKKKNPTTIVATTTTTEKLRLGIRKKQK